MRDWNRVCGSVGSVPKTSRKAKPFSAALLHRKMSLDDIESVYNMKLSSIGVL